MAEVTDPSGVRWSVRRRRWYDLTGFPVGCDDLGLGGLMILITLVGGWWPFSFIAHRLGLSLADDAIDRDGEQVEEEWVRGWRNSHLRIQEIIESATAGTLQQSPLPVPPPATDSA